MSSADAELCVSKNKRPDERTRPASHEVDEPRELTIYFLHRDRGGRIFPGGPAVRDPVAGLRIAHQFVCGPVSLCIEFAADYVLSRGDLAGAAHKVDRDCRYRLGRLVIKDLHGLGIVENIEVLIVAFVARVA